MRDLEGEYGTVASKLEEKWRYTTGYLPPPPFRGEFYLVIDDQAPRSYLHMQKPDNALYIPNTYKHGQPSMQLM